MKLISLNLGIKIDNTKQVCRFLRKEKPDIAAFQESVRPLSTTVFSLYRSHEGIERATKSFLPYSFFGPNFASDGFWKQGKLHRDFNGRIEQGNEIRSRFPIVHASNEHYHRAYELWNDSTQFYTKDQPRAVQIVEILVGKKRLQLLNLHGTYSRDKRDSERSMLQNQFVLKAAKQRNLPTIIVGDFNLEPNTTSMGLIRKDFRDLVRETKVTATIPKVHDGEERKERVIDYIFVDERIKVSHFSVIESDISDHYPLMLEFEIH